MADKVTAAPKISIDRLFPIPTGAEDVFVYTEDTIRTGATGTDDTTVLDYESTDEASTDPAVAADAAVADSNVSADPTTFPEEPILNESVLDVPTDFAVFSQTLRRAPGGQQVVDVLIDTEEIGGAINYEFQVTKI